MGKHRLDALCDGIFAVAMTLLVIELKLPEGLALRDSAALVHVLEELAPKLISWVTSFFVLAIFWWGHTRALDHLRHIDGWFAFLNILFLACVSFMPFASAVSGAHIALFGAQCIYSGTMLLTALAAISIWRYIHRHPELCEKPMPAAAYRAARVRNGMLVAISIAACVIAWFVPGAGNVAFMLMAFSGPVSRRIAARSAH